jgi:hypothetical protein
MSSMLNIGISGLNAAQVALSHREQQHRQRQHQRLQRRERDAGRKHRRKATGQYTIGSGVDVVGRAARLQPIPDDRPVEQQLQSAGCDHHEQLTSTLNSAFSGSGNLQTSLDNFYSGFSSVANSPSSSSTRQAALGDCIVADGDVQHARPTVESAIERRSTSRSAAPSPASTRLPRRLPSSTARLARPALAAIRILCSISATNWCSSCPASPVYRR